jgi:hypothetical protein
MRVSRFGDRGQKHGVAFASTAIDRRRRSHRILARVALTGFAAVLISVATAYGGGHSKTLSFKDDFSNLSSGLLNKASTVRDV